MYSSICIPVFASRHMTKRPCGGVMALAIEQHIGHAQLLQRFQGTVYLVQGTFTGNALALR